jgi:diadenosine tetraphosphate (Ap4A) HIT family hydrolase
MSFVLHPRLAADTAALAEWPLCSVLLMNDARFPWLVLVPRIANASELFDLAEAEQKQLAGELARAAHGLKEITGADKINIGALGNLVPQLHWHVVARTRSDSAWPGPVWSSGAAIPYTDLNAARARYAALG